MGPRFIELLLKRLMPTVQLRKMRFDGHVGLSPCQIAA
jgi:hypothetical protein